MRGLNSDCVDLIHLDPPFNSKAAFKDTWTLDDLDVEWIREIEAREPYLHAPLNACMTDSDKAYMAIRLLEMRRLLKPTNGVNLVAL